MNIPAKYLRRAFTLSFVLLTASRAFGHDYGGYAWHMSSRPPLVPQWRVVTVNQVREKCQHRYANACAFFDLRAGTCNVYASQSEAETPAWLRWHEYLHCAGWDHDANNDVVAIHIR